MLLDTTYDIATPEGVELRLPLAGLAPRSLAWIVDAFIKTIAIGILSAVFSGLLGNFGYGIALIVTFVAFWFYNVLFEVLNHGATPGKRLFAVKVMNANGTPVGWSGSLLRNLIRAVDVLPGCYAFGCVSVLLSEKFQRLGDLAAGTVVVHAPKERTRAKADPVEALPLAVPLSLDEQQAIVDFGERASGINRDRAEELARVLEPVLGHVDANRLRAHAQWLAGRDPTA